MTKKKEIVFPVKKKKENVAEFWKEIVETWFLFCKEKYDEKPSFDPVSAKLLKKLVEEIKKRAIEKNVVWSAEEAVSRLRGFLTMAHRDRWLQEHFLIKNIYQNRQQIFFIKDSKNGRASNEVVGKTIVFDKP